MDVHRSRFVPYPSPPVNAIAFSRSNDKGIDGPRPALKLAIGRANGDIEIWNPNNGYWLQEVVFHGNQGTSIDGLAWTQDPDELAPDNTIIAGQQRLFSISSTAAVTEWDLGNGRPLRESTGSFGEVWCLAVQPRQPVSKQTLLNTDTEHIPSHQEIAIGCGDGTLALLSTADDDLVFKRFMARSGSKKTRCMSVIWQNRQRVVAGFNDSTIRIYDARNGALLRNMSTGAGIPGAPKDTLVWRVRALPNGDIVSADSNGDVRFWDGKTYSLVQRVAGHSSDCLELITSSDGQIVYSGGMDGRVATYRLTGRDNKRHWAKLGQRRHHKGDIKSMAVYDEKALSVVVTGGHDASPTFIPLRHAGRTQHRKISGLGQAPPCLSVPARRLLVCWWDHTVYIWKIAKQEAPSHIDDESAEPSRQLVSRIVLNGHESISAVTASPDGRLLFVGTRNSTRAFMLRSSSDPSDARLRVRTLEIPSDLEKTGAKLLNMSPDGRWLSVVTPDNEIHVARTTESVDDQQLMRQIVELDRSNHKYGLQSGLGGYERSVIRAQFSPDSSVLVVGDVSGYLDAWALEGQYDSSAPAVDTVAHDSKSSSASGSETDSESSDSDSDLDDDEILFHGQHWTNLPSGIRLPRLDSAPLFLSFRPLAPTRPTTTGTPGLHPTRHNPHAHSHELPSSPSLLFTLTQSHRIYEFDIRTGSLSDWARRNPFSCLPSGFTIIKDRAKGIVWEVQKTDEGQRERAWLYGANWVGMLDVSQDFASRSEIDRKVDERTNLIKLDGEVRETKRRESEASGGRARKRRRGPASEVPEVEMGGLVTSSRKTVDGMAIENDDKEQSDGEDVDQNEKAIDSSDDEDANSDGEFGPLAGLEGRLEKNVQTYKATKRAKWWSTFKYKPILGLVPLSPAVHSPDSTAKSDDAGSTEAQTMEVVLVERPDWDLLQIRSLDED